MLRGHSVSTQLVIFLLKKVIHYFVEGGQNGNFLLKFRAKIQVVKMASEIWQHHNVILHRDW